MQKKYHYAGIYESYVKPYLDWGLALVFVGLFWWVYLIIAILVRKNLGSPVIFKQERAGQIDRNTGKEMIFTLYKFRSMLPESTENKTDADRLTDFGKKLRSTSLDELPEIVFNILIYRNMSWVGPRPLLVKYVDLYSEHQRHRHDVKPGLTGLAQVNGRNAISWEEKFDLDVEYVNHISFWGDLKIFLTTIIKVFKKDGVTSETSVTMEEFKGSKES